MGAFEMHSLFKIAPAFILLYIDYEWILYSQQQLVLGLRHYPKCTFMVTQFIGHGKESK